MIFFCQLEKTFPRSGSDWCIRLAMNQSELGDVTTRDAYAPIKARASVSCDWTKTISPISWVFAMSGVDFRRHCLHEMRDFYFCCIVYLQVIDSEHNAVNRNKNYKKSHYLERRSLCRTINTLISQTKLKLWVDK